MGDVVSLAEHRPHLSGNAKCAQCGHAFVAVMPVGEIWIECPNCRSEKACLRGPVQPHDSACSYTCGCGSDVFSFWLTDGGVRVMCCVCGSSDHGPCT
jgi:hypothetical protein